MKQKLEEDTLILPSSKKEELHHQRTIEAETTSNITEQTQCTYKQTNQNMVWRQPLM